MNLIYLLIAICLAVIGVRYLAMSRRRKRLLSSPLPKEYRAILSQKMGVFDRLPDDLRTRLEGLTNRFLADVKFFGAGGFEVTDEVRVLIAAQACLLIVNKENRWYSSLNTIHVYPAAFRSQAVDYDGHLEHERESHRIGESWTKGPVILAWDHAAYGAFVDDDAQNVVMHEFAHQLDDQTGAADGSPLLDKEQSAAHWAHVFQDAYQRLQKDVKAGRKNILDAYGATAPAEFFAVATETFFECASELQAAEPTLYKELSAYYRLDPASWRD